MSYYYYICHYILYYNYMSYYYYIIMLLTCRKKFSESGGWHILKFRKPKIVQNTTPIQLNL